MQIRRTPRPPTRGPNPRRRSLISVLAVALAGCSEGVDPPDEMDEVDDEVEPDDVEAVVGDYACFPGATGSGQQCWRLLGDPFSDGVDNDAYYGLPSNCASIWHISPIAYFRLWKMDSSTKVSPHFTLGELAKTYVDQQYMLLQPHAVRELEEVRAVVGPIKVTSGYRPPGYNAQLDGSASCSRHMYGDGFDLVPLAASTSALAAACTDRGAWIKTYNDGHVHCDFRNASADPSMFTSAATADVAVEDEVAAEITEHRGVLRASSRGFDEGEPTHEWTAFDVDDNVIARGAAVSFEPPAEAVRVTVVVGSAAKASIEL